MATKNPKMTANGKAAKSRTKGRADDVAAEKTGPSWTFMTNHTHVLTVLDSEPKLVLREVALRVGITERAVQRIVVDLEDSEFLEVEKIGRRNHYKVLKNQPLRHPIEAHRSIADLLKMITG